MANKIDASRHTGIVQKIPLFAGLSLHQIQQVLKATNLEAHPAGHFLFHGGDKSTTLYILLSGKLIVKDGAAEVGEIKPVDLVGEMGIVTDSPRSASIEVIEEATLLSISKMRFDILMKNDVVMAALIYRNMLDSLSRKLRTTNDRHKVGAF
jgi:CRP-like cAMP-binding protein